MGYQATPPAATKIAKVSSTSNCGPSEQFTENPATT